MRRRSKKKNASAKEVLQVLKKYQTFLVTSHINLEGDALGSQLAMGHLIEKLGNKRVEYVDATPVPELLQFLPKQHKVSTNLKKKRAPQVLITVDCPNVDRIGGVANYITPETIVIVVDHHISNQRFGDINWVDPKAAATGEMIYRLYQLAKVPIDKTAALNLYTTIVTDTGRFAYSNTTSQTHLIVADLLKKGIQPYKVTREIYESNSFSNQHLLAKALSTLKMAHKGKTSYLQITRKMLNQTRCKVEHTEGFCDYARGIQGVEVGFSIREEDKKGWVKLSFRSKGKINVSKLAIKFNGGGHAAASGATLKGSLLQVTRKVLKAISDEYRSLGID